MAQRFAIDGNFTQSFVGTVKLNATACAAGEDSLASLYYDLDTGAVCYVTASEDFCYEFIFDSETTRVSGKSGDDVITKAFATVGKFQFVGVSGGEGPVGTMSYPKTNLDDTLYLLFNSESAQGNDVYSYLIQNPSTGSISLSTSTQEILFRYHSQTTEGDQIVLGSSDFTASLESSSLSLISATSNPPFLNGERVCVNVSSQGEGGTATTYQTGSDETFTSLNNLKIIDYDSNVFVTSDPLTGQLILQFGTPALPSITSFTVPVDGNQGSDAFNRNRFSGPGSGLYVIDNNYKMILQYETASTNTFLSASILGVREGDYETLATSTETDGNITFNISDFSAADQAYFESGSHYFKGAVHVLLEDGSSFTTQSAAVNVALSKSDPSGLTPKFSWDLWPSTDYANNTAISNATDSQIELGATGSITFWAETPSDSNGWRGVAGYPTVSVPTIRLIGDTSVPATLEFEAYWDSNGLGTPTEFTASGDKGFTRITSLRYGAFPSGTFADNLSPTNAELLDLKDWTDNGGTILFGTNTSGDINNEIFDITWSGDKYHYVIIDDAVTLTEINVDGFGSLSTAFTTGTTANYRFYVTTGIQAGGTGTTAQYKLFT